MQIKVYAAFFCCCVKCKLCTTHAGFSFSSGVIWKKKMLKTFLPCIFISCLRCYIAKGAYSYCILLHTLFSVSWHETFSFWHFLHFYTYILWSALLSTLHIQYVGNSLGFHWDFFPLVQSYGWIMHSRHLKWQHWRRVLPLISLVRDSSSVCQVREWGVYNMFYKFKDSFGVYTCWSQEVYQPSHAFYIALHLISTTM